MQTFCTNFAAKYELQLSVFSFHSTIENYMFLESCWHENINDISLISFTTFSRSFAILSFRKVLQTPIFSLTYILRYHNSEREEANSLCKLLQTFCSMFATPCKKYVLVENISSFLKLSDQMLSKMCNMSCVLNIFICAKKCAKCQLQKFSIFPSLNYLNWAENQNDMIYRFSMNLQNL